MSDLITAHLEFLQNMGYSDETVEDRTKILWRLHRSLQPLGVERATTASIQRFLGRRAWKPWTRCTYDMHVRSAYNWWTDNGYLDGNPVTWAPPHRPKLVPRPATDEAVAVALSLPEPVATAALLAAYAGLRAAEIADCSREDITETTLYIPRGKGGDPAMVVTHPAVWRHVRNRDPGRLVRNHRTGAAVEGHWVSDTSRRWMKRAGLSCRLHSLRHWHATTLLRAGANLRTVQECMRHASIQSTAGYTKVVDEQRRVAVLSLPTPRGARAS